MERMGGVMPGRKRCYLCGGKLVDGRCIECGLDNQKNAKKPYRLNESIQGGQSSEIVHESGRKAGIVLIGIIVFLLAAVAAVSMIRIWKEHTQVEIQPGEEYDEYGFVTRDLSQSGDAYDETLMGGYYEIGVHIPEGIYTVEAKSGDGAIYLIDDENGIYIWQQIGNDPQNPNQVDVMEDLRLYDGAFLEVKSGAALRFYSDCAQTEKLHGEKNPLQETVRVETGQMLTAGRDFPEGVYHVTSESDWNDLMMTLPDSFLAEYEEGGEGRIEAISFAPNELEISYANVPIPKGTVIQTTGAAVTLEPSKTIGSTDYGEIYRE